MTIAIDEATRKKWDHAAKCLDRLSAADDRRFAPVKQRLFSKMYGKSLMVAAGTGNDFKHFPPGQDIVALDISPKMLEMAAPRAVGYPGTLTLKEADVCNLDYPDNTFDTVLTVCTFCSVPKPILGLTELHRVLKPGGQILMFEHMRSAVAQFGVLLDLMTPLSRRFGPELNRDTVGNVLKAGFKLRRVENVYLDIVRIIEAVKEPAS
jgi:ubiquinone/menaquinone biosynthesis C-methylase UbiE